MKSFNPRAGRVAVLILAAAFLLPHVAHAQTLLKVLDWNTHHGVGTDGDYNLQRFVTWIARSGANVVSLNEVERFSGSWGNEDQPARYAALLKAATGKTWYQTFAQRDGGTNGQGNLILSTFPIEVADDRTLSYSRSVARLQIVVNGVRVNVFSTHLDADSSTRRAQQMAELKSWASGFSQQHIFAGDFNAWPGAAEIANMTAFAYDAWAQAKAGGMATAYAGNEAGNTRNSRIDYVWYSKGASQLVLKGAQVFDTRDANGVMPSDHRPIMATFQVGSAAAGTGSTPVAAVPVTPPTKTAADFDGDRRSDLSVYRSSTGEWFVTTSGGSGLRMPWGAPAMGDIPVAGDYDGDGRADAAVFRPPNGTWYIRYTRTGASASMQWGGARDLAVPADFDGDGRTDITVFRPANGVWYIRLASTGATTGLRWGAAGDVPVPGDYDGDRKADMAVFRPSNATWYIRHSSTGASRTVQWGLAGDVTVPGDYDADGLTDVAVFRPATGMWHVRFSRNGATSAFQWGAATDKPVAGDYDGDGKTDLAVFRPATAVWYVRYSATGASAGIQWGSGSDVPVLSRIQ